MQVGEDFVRLLPRQRVEGAAEVFGDDHRVDGHFRQLVVHELDPVWRGGRGGEGRVRWYARGG